MERTHDGSARPLALAVAVGLVVGVLTAYAQGWLSDSTSSLANSAGPWSLAAFVIARSARRLPVAVLAGAATLASCELGYAVAAHVHGGSNATSTVVFWLTAAVIAGPILGVAAALSRRAGVRAGLGFAVMAGVLIGEGAFGWTTVADTTDWRYWAVELAIGVAVLAWAAVRTRRATHALVTVASGGACALVVFVAGRAA